MTSAQMNIVLVDDHRVFRDGLRALIATQEDLRVVGEASCAHEAYEVVSSTLPQIVILDLALPGADGIEIGRRILGASPDRALLALTMLRDGEHVRRALNAGFLGYALKDVAIADLLIAIRAVARREQYVSAGILDAPPAQEPLLKLTQREREVYELTISGMTSRQIGRRLTISARTVESHRFRILHKLGAKSALDLVRQAAQMGLFARA
jgi:two-component system invasion response regulator UvrY